MLYNISIDVINHVKMIPQAMWLIIKTVFKVLTSLLKILLFIIILTYIYAVSKIVTKELLDNRPIKFERYIAYESFKDRMQRLFSQGSNAQTMIELFEKSGGQCGIRLNQSSIKSEKYNISCDYETDFASMSLLTYILPIKYHIYCITDEKYKVIFLRAWHGTEFM